MGQSDYEIPLNDAGADIVKANKSDSEPGAVERVLHRNVTIQLRNENDKALGAPLDVPEIIDHKQLQALVNQLLDDDEKGDEPVPCVFYLRSPDGTVVPISRTVSEATNSFTSLERVLDVVYQPQALFRVAPVTRCTSSMPGHGEAVVCAAFSPHGRHLASGSGDTTVRLWDVDTETPLKTLKGHTHWVLCLAWSPDGQRIATGDKRGEVRVWKLNGNGDDAGIVLNGHKQWITSLAWQPMHVDVTCRLVASSSKDTDVRIWDVTTRLCVRILSSHTASVTCLRWGGAGLIYTASQDRTIKVWRAADGVMCRTLDGHGHWVNTMALNVDYVLRTGCVDPTELVKAAGGGGVDSEVEPNASVAKERYLKAKANGPEILISGSDDFTLYLWHPETAKKPIARMTGHMLLVNHVVFSPDARLVASASFDKSVKLWCGRTGVYIATLRGHVQAVYQLAWSADSRLLVSSSADSTVKLWRCSKASNMCKLSIDLPGHADEVYAVDWSPDGLRVVSGGKDKVLKVWRK